MSNKQNDTIRSMHISTFHCAVCGEQLKVSYNPDTPAKDEEYSGMPTGAAMVHSRTSIWPCQKCMQPAKDAAQAISTLIGIGAVKP